LDICPLDNLTVCGYSVDIAREATKMKTTNAGVVKAWLDGNVARSGTMHTDGTDVYSHGLKIGTTRDGVKMVYDYRAKNTISMTTSNRVPLLAAGGVVYVKPEQCVYC